LDKRWGMIQYLANATPRRSTYWLHYAIQFEGAFLWGRTWTTFPRIRVGFFSLRRLEEMTLSDPVVDVKIICSAACKWTVKDSLVFYLHFFLVDSMLNESALALSGSTRIRVMFSRLPTSKTALDLSRFVTPTPPPVFFFVFLCRCVWVFFFFGFVFFFFLLFGLWGLRVPYGESYRSPFAVIRDHEFFFELANTPP